MTIWFDEVPAREANQWLNAHADFLSAIRAVREGSVSIIGLSTDYK
ncbi:hypothetical protein FDI24_gp235 [Acidovorax phage ACP17]|uniref:Uncharacterized protein n=1 Tax=Acidovorax phage ACP17 TaxID=2010329 RepID=A0A218M386_9CAUD|nr:hypothetical protein FDI24_gp235 [Acidovorax phage ACP17]ASD50516.1 hypothetical protein [Acidovorax phage ACP17]